MLPAIAIMCVLLLTAVINGDDGKCWEMLQHTDVKVAQLTKGGPLLFHCPTAKAGTTTIEDFINEYRPGYDPKTRTDNRDSFLFSTSSPLTKFSLTRLLPWDDVKFLCSQPHISFTTVRNPWDRLFSGFIGKVVIQGQYAPKRIVDHPENFIEFVEWVTEALKSNPHDVNFHFWPSYMRCSPAILNYTFISKVEDGLVADLDTAIELMNEMGKGKRNISAFEQGEGDHISTTDVCEHHKNCWKHYKKYFNMSSVERRKALFRPDRYPEINRNFWELFRPDIVEFGYTFGDPVIDEKIANYMGGEYKYPFWVFQSKGLSSQKSNLKLAVSK